MLKSPMGLNLLHMMELHGFLEMILSTVELENLEKLLLKIIALLGLMR